MEFYILERGKAMILYKDKSISITDRDITIDSYYFPMGQAKVIPWQKVKSVSVEPVTLLNGKYRMWGMGLKPYWFNSDWRTDKKFMFVIDTGKLIKSAITPEDFDSARTAVEKKILIRFKEGDPK
jgi:hypothetical protein